MNKSDLLKELRARTQAGMKDCHDALREANDDLEKAVDIIKTKGQNIVSSREAKVAADGRVGVSSFADTPNSMAMVEINCQTDFVANSPAFQTLVEHTADSILQKAIVNDSFSVSEVEQERAALVTSTKENVVVRRWWVEQAFDSRAKVFSYVHTNHKIGVLLTLMASSEAMAQEQVFIDLGSDLAMQVAAMTPVAVDAEQLPADTVSRQRSIFETQLQELNKPQAQWDKIITGKFNKWHTEVCLLSQESIIVPKTSVSQVIKNVAGKLGGEIQVVKFIRCQVGEGIEEEKSDYLAEVAKLAGDNH